jgi:hypothetical protein
MTKQKQSCAPISTIFSGAWIFKTVNILFLIAGHTKNVCDRRFNNLKKLYNKSYVYTLHQAVEVLGKSKFVTV